MFGYWFSLLSHVKSNIKMSILHRSSRRLSRSVFCQYEPGWCRRSGYWFRTVFVIIILIFIFVVIVIVTAIVIVIVIAIVIVIVIAI